MCDNNVIVRNVFVYRRMNAYKNVFVYILLHTFLKMTSLSITDKNVANQIYERNRFPHQICVSYHCVHPITCVQQLPVII